MEPQMKNNGWETEWVGMPEFVQDKQRPHAAITFRFKNEEDLQAFATLIGQKLTNKTKSAWYPYKSHFSDVKYEWADKKKEE